MSKSMSFLCFSAILLLCIFHVGSLLDCESCGKECKQICGTKRFRNCCYNYIKKRSGSGVHLELMMIDPETFEYYPPLSDVLAGYEDGYRPKMYPEGTDREK